MTAKGSRGQKTRERLLDAAERLFAEYGFSETSLRAVTSEAGANLAAVGYHFGSKADLLREVVRRVVRPLHAEQLRLLEELEGGEREPSVEELLDAYVSPMFELLTRDGGGDNRLLARLLFRILSDPGRETQRIAISEVKEVDERYLRAFGQVLPHLPPEELWWRFKSMVGMVVFHRAEMLSEEWPSETPPGSATDEHVWTVTFLTAALRAPASSPRAVERTE